MRNGTTINIFIWKTKKQIKNNSEQIKTTKEKHQLWMKVLNNKSPIKISTHQVITNNKNQTKIWEVPQAARE